MVNQFYVDNGRGSRNAKCKTGFLTFTDGAEHGLPSGVCTQSERAGKSRDARMRRFKSFETVWQRETKIKHHE